MIQFRPLTIPQHAHPLVRQLFEEMNRRKVSLSQMAAQSGVSLTAIKRWNRHTPALINLDACFTTLGIELTARYK